MTAAACSEIRSSSRRWSSRVDRRRVVVDRDRADEPFVEDERADERRLQRGLGRLARGLEVRARARVDQRAPVARHPADQPVAVPDRQLLDALGLDAGGEAAPQRLALVVVEEERAARERHDVAQLRRDERHRVRDAEAAAHRLRDLVERVDLAVGERDVLEDVGARRAGRRPGRRRLDQADGGARGRRVRGDARQLARRLPGSLRPRRRVRVRVDEGLHDARVERLVRFLPQQAHRRLEAHRLVVRPLRHQRVEVVHDGEDARAERNLVGLEAGRVALAVEALVVAEDERRHRIGERHAADDLGADLRVDADLLELLLRERSRLGEDVLGDRELADVVQERRRLHALDLGVRHAERPRQARRVDLDAPDVALRRLVLRVDGERERFDGRQVQVRDLLHVPLLILHAARGRPCRCGRSGRAAPPRATPSSSRRGR